MRAPLPGTLTVMPESPSRREPPPSSRQIHTIARELAQEACIPWPATRAEASALIAHLRGEGVDKG